MKTSIRNIAEALGADSPELIDYDIDTLLTDSRELTKPSSSLFFAIATKSNDGHRYIPALYEAGVRNFAVTRSFDTSKYPSANFLLVSDTIAALQQAAALAPAQSNALRVAVAGSLGKTTVKEWLYRLLESDCQISRSPRSYNSQIGVPLSVWQTEAEADLALIETAATRPGEMQKIAACLDPHTVIVTNYIDARSGDFADGQAMAEATLPPLLSHARTVIFPADNQAAAGEVAKQARHYL